MRIDDLPPAARTIVEDTDWPALSHARGPAVDTPTALLELLSEDPITQAKALRHVNDPVTHQNTIYPVTPPVARYVAAILSHPRTANVLPEPFTCSLRVGLLDWITALAFEVDNRVEARWGSFLRSGPEWNQTRGVRPELFDAVFPFVHDSDLAVREAALAASVPLVDDPELVPHRATLSPMIRDALATSTNRMYRAIVVGGLAAWGVETGLPPAAHESPDAERGHSDDPPF